MGIITLTTILPPLIKGATLVSGSVILYSGGKYIIHKTFLQPNPLIEELEKLSEEKFSKTSLVSTTLTPTGTSLYKLKVPTGFSDKELLKLIPALQTKFDCEIQVWSEEKHFYLDVSYQPIPKTLQFDTEKVREELAKKEFAMYLGESRFGPVLIDFTNNATPHLLFGGPTGGGKSNLLNQGICGMLEYYTPNELELHLIDLKDGVELGDYRDVSHVQSFSENPLEAEQCLDYLLGEIERRNTLFKESKKIVKKLSSYNRENDNPLPRILVIADEFAQFDNIAEKEFKKSIYTKWERVLQTGRSTGVHVMIGTQVADANVFPKQIKGNIDARFGFKFSDPQHSRMITGGSELRFLPNIQGRGIFKIGTHLQQTQVPYISEEQVQETIYKYSISKPKPASKEPVIIEEVPPKEVQQSDISLLFMDEGSFLETTKSRYEE